MKISGYLICSIESAEHTGFLPLGHYVPTRQADDNNKTFMKLKLLLYSSFYWRDEATIQLVFGPGR